LLHEGSPTRVVGEYIVVLQPELNPDQVTQHVEELVAEFTTSSAENKILHGTFNIGKFKGFSAQLSLDMLARERVHPDVSFIEVNQEVQASDSCVTEETILWNLDRISEILLDLDGEYHYLESAGDGVDAYIVDTVSKLTTTTLKAEHVGVSLWIISKLTAMAMVPTWLAL
jgi:hypothetical protein